MNWDEYGIAMAKTIASKSKDPSSKVGCYITDSDHCPVSMGYNGHIKGASEELLSYERPTKYFTIIHAEMNALVHARRSLKNCIAYVTHGPCENCLKHLVQAGVTKIIYADAGIMKHRGTPEQKDAIGRIVLASGVSVHNLNGVAYTAELFNLRS